MDQLLEAQTTDLRKHEQFHSELLEGDRDLIVYVPEGYEENAEQRYPVLYLQDGQNLFDPETSFGGVDWRVDKTAEMLIAHKAVRPLIVVGIYNTGERRIHEYTPTRDPKHGGGYADLYGRMLTEEIKPFIDAQYRTFQGAHSTAVGGSSLGGLVSLYLGLQYSGVFGKLAVMSPSVWWNKRAILKFLGEFDAKPDLQIWLDIGTAEGAQGGLRCTIAARQTDPPRLRRRQRPDVLRSGGREAYRIRLGGARRPDAAILVSRRILPSAPSARRTAITHTLSGASRGDRLADGRVGRLIVIHHAPVPARDPQLLPQRIEVHGRGFVAHLAIERLRVHRFRSPCRRSRTLSQAPNPG